MTDGDAPPAPAGWYPDPEKPEARRYWDGHEWTSLPEPPANGEPPTVHQRAETTAPDAPPASDIANRLTSQSSLVWVSALACVLMGVGGVGAWATALGIVPVSGTRGDGWLLVVAGVAGLCALWTYAMRPRVWPLLAAILIGGTGAAVSGVDLHKIASVGATSLFGQEVHLVRPAWGIYLAIGASVAFALLSLVTAVLGPQSARSRSNVPAILVSIVFGVGAAVAVANVGTEKATAGDSSAPTTSEASTETTSESATTPTTDTPAVTSEGAERALSEYAGAYSTENVARLEAMFMPDLSRTDGTHATEDRSEALTTYRKQFSQLHEPSYELTEREVTQEEGGATAQARYSITSQNGTVGGTVTFHLVPNGSGVGIDTIKVEPNP
jgi:Protein of unknown function (DUF2510)/SnoaL-like domain